MKNDGTPELADVPKLLQRYRDRKDIGAALGARAALFDACEELMDTAAKEERALKPDELRRYDECAAEMRKLSGELAEYKRQRVAGIVASGFPAEYCRLPF